MILGLLQALDQQIKISKSQVFFNKHINPNFMNIVGTTLNMEKMGERAPIWASTFLGLPKKIKSFSANIS